MLVAGIIAALALVSAVAWALGRARGRSEGLQLTGAGLAGRALSDAMIAFRARDTAVETLAGLSLCPGCRSRLDYELLESRR